MVRFFLIVYPGMRTDAIGEILLQHVNEQRAKKSRNKSEGTEKVPRT
jgi:hypothetical protein